MEVWKDIIGYEGIYQVSSFGRVKSLKYDKERILSLSANKNGYIDVSLLKNGKRKHALLHRLVAEAFLPNPNNLPQVNHKDENKLNCHVDNLEWCDCVYNNNYSHAVPVYCIELDRVFPSIKIAIMELGVSAGNISNCCRGKRKTCCSYHWRYVEREKSSN